MCKMVWKFCEIWNSYGNWLPDGPNSVRFCMYGFLRRYVPFERTAKTDQTLGPMGLRLKLMCINMPSLDQGLEIQK